MILNLVPVPVESYKATRGGSPGVHTHRRPGRATEHRMTTSSQHTPSIAFLLGVRNDMRASMP